MNKSKYVSYLLLLGLLLTGLVSSGVLAAESGIPDSQNIVSMVEDPMAPSGYYEIRSNAEGAGVFFDDQQMGTIVDGILLVQVPITKKPIYSTVTVRANGYKPYSEAILQVPKPGTTLVLRCMLSAMPYNLSGSLTIAASPVGCTVFIDEKPVGVVDPSGIFSLGTIETGNRKVSVRMAGYQDYNQWIYVTQNSQNKLRVTLVPITNGTLQITSTPVGAGISLNGGYQGITPLTIPDLEQGSYSVKLTLPGYLDYVTATTVQAGQTTPISAVLQLATTPTMTPVETAATTSPTQIPSPRPTRAGLFPFTAVLGIGLVGILYLQKKRD